MRIFAIGDLHLPGGDLKPMDVFGEHWRGHFERICQDWSERVAPEDVVLIPGDISWAMTLTEALTDLQAISRMPGTILLLRGNHDYWWNSVSRLRSVLPPKMHAIQNDCFQTETCVFCGTRGWNIPGEDDTDPHNEKIYRREVARLKLSLDEGRRVSAGRPLFVMMHYPPLMPDQMEQGTEFTHLMTEYGVNRCVYGHLHGLSIRRGICAEYAGVRYDLVSCDALDFRLLEVPLV